jgi:WD40 repeat protein
VRADFRRPQGNKYTALFQSQKILTVSFQDFVLSVCLTPDGHWVMSGSKDRGVQFWDPITGNAQMMLQGHKNSGSSDQLAQMVSLEKKL